MEDVNAPSTTTADDTASLSHGERERFTCVQHVTDSELEPATDWGFGGRVQGPTSNVRSRREHTALKARRKAVRWRNWQTLQSMETKSTESTACGRAHQRDRHKGKQAGKAKLGCKRGRGAAADDSSSEKHGSRAGVKPPVFQTMERMAVWRVAGSTQVSTRRYVEAWEPLQALVQSIEVG